MVVDLVAAVPDAAVVVATGETPMGLYRELARRRTTGDLDASSLRVFQLDEYAGIAVDDARSLFGWTLRSFVEPLGVDPRRVVSLPRDGEVSSACAAYDRTVEDAGGYDLAILGLGTNGHIGFNEPPAEPDAPTREVALSPESIRSNARYWGSAEDVPARAVTAGMAQLLAARRTILLASGEHKRRALHEALEVPPTPEIPASFLQWSAEAIVLADRAAWGAPTT
jgi:glucosamine-6-phosphate deaminase